MYNNNLWSPRPANLSDPIDDFEDREVAALHERRQRAIEKAENDAYLHRQQKKAESLLHLQNPNHQHYQPTNDPFGADSDEDTEDASEDGDLRDIRSPVYLSAKDLDHRHGPFKSAAAGGSSQMDGISMNVDNINDGESEDERRLKEQAYFDKLNILKSQLLELEELSHIRYVEGLHKLKDDLTRRLENSSASFEIESHKIERDYSQEQKLIGREFEDKKIELRESLINELEEKKKQIEMERYSYELTSDPTEVKPMNTRKLRRRPNDPAPLPERRKKTSQLQVTFLLDDREIDEDLKAFHSAFVGGSSISGKGKKSESSRKASSIETDYSSESSHSDSRIEDGKLFYEKRWFHRGQPVFVEGQGMSKVGGVICSISQDLVWVRKVSDQTKIRVPIASLQKGRLFIKRRAN